MSVWRRKPVAAAAAAAGLRAEAERQHHAAQRLAAVLESVDAAVLAVDASQHPWFANPAAQRLLPSLQRLPLLLQWLEMVATTRQPWHSRMDLADGRTLEVHITPMPLEGSVVVARDITETVRLETARRDFIAGISHELRTPLTSVQGYAELLQQHLAARPEPGAAAEYLEAIVRNTTRLTNLARDLVTLSSIETGTYPFHFEPVAAAALAGPVLEVLAPLAHSRGCRVRLGPVEEGTLRGDRNALHRVLLNLVENAIIHGLPGDPGPSGGEIEVDISGTVEAGEYVFRVHDNGRGIASTDRPHIFERFYRVDRSHARGPGAEHGTGLGLALVKHIVLEHGGRVEVDSALGEGSTFRVRLPLWPEGESA